MESAQVERRQERGRPPYDPEMMLGLLLYGHMRRIRSSRRLAEACRRDVSFMYVAGRATPGFHTISEFRRRFTEETKGLFVQVLRLCREAGLVRLGHVSLDGTKLRANAFKHKAMSYGRMLSREKALEEEVARWQEEAERQDREEDALYGRDDDGYSLPPELREPGKRLQTWSQPFRANSRLWLSRWRRGEHRRGNHPGDGSFCIRAVS